MPTAFDQQDLDDTMEQIKAKMTAETEQRSILSKALDIIGTLVGAKRVAKADESDSASPAETDPLEKSDASHVHVHLHNGESDSSEDAGEDDDSDGMTPEEDREDDAAMADAIVNDILEIFEQHYSRHDKGGAAMDKSVQETSNDLVKSFLSKALTAQTAYEDRLTALETSQAALLQEMQMQTALSTKHTEALDTLGKAMLQLGTTQEAMHKSLTIMTAAQEARDSQPQPSRYEAARQALPAGTGQVRTAHGFDKKRAADALAKGLITLNSPEYRDWKYRGIVPEAVLTPLG